MSGENSNNPGIGESQATTVVEKPHFTPLAPIHSAGDSLSDMDGLKALSRESFNDKYSIVKGKVVPKSDPGSTRVDDEDDEDDDMLGDGRLPEDAEPEPDKEAEETSAKVKSPQPRQSEPEEVDEDEEIEGDEEGFDVEEEISHKKFLVGRLGDRQIRMSREAIVGIPVDGRIIDMPLQQALDRASENIHAKNEVAVTRQERERLYGERQEFEQERQQTYDNYEILMDMATNGDPEDVFEFFAVLTNRDPLEIRNQIINKSLQVYQRLSSMTPQERETHNKLRRYQFAEKQQAKFAESEQRRRQNLADAQFLENELKREGLEVDDFRAAADNMIEMQKRGELRGNVPIAEVVRHAVRLRHRDKVQYVVKAFGTKGQGEKFAEETSLTISEYEKLNGRRLSNQQALAVVKRARGLDRKALSDSAGNKADRQIRSGKVPSNKPSQKRKLESKASLTLGDHYKRVHGDDTGR